jgi:hypothetical protein
MIRNRNSVQGQSLIARKIDLPGDPVIGTATNIASSLYNNGSATVAFTASAFGGPAASFTATSSPGGFTASGTSSPITVAGLQSNTNYTFTVAAVNGSGTGAPSAASNQITAVTTPQAPTVGTATIVSTSQVSLTFTPSANDGGSAITGYSVVSSPSVALTVSGGTTSPVTVTGTFNAAQAYTFTIAGVNAGGTGAFSAASNSIIPRPGIAATGGTITTSGGYKYHTFTANGTFAISANAQPFEYLIVAGGGGGGSWGGGGAGGLLQNTYSVTANGDSYAITVGGGGGSSAKGTDSTIVKNTSTTVVTASAGGAGGNNDSSMNGGSGGGTGYSNTPGTGIAGPPRQGYDGNNAPGSYYNGGGGGGGAGGTGGAGNTSPTSPFGGNGGTGASYSVWAGATSTGVSNHYAGGGGGAIWSDGNNYGNGAGGTGGGGRGEVTNSGASGPSINPQPGTANTGGGGGARFTANPNQCLGGSGIVIVRYPG